MTLLLFFIISALMSIAIVLLKNKTVTRIITIGVLLLAVLSLLTIPTVYHGFIYAKKDEAKKFNIYHSALIGLMTFMSGAYLANGMTVLWIFVEATTLAVAALIYHDRTEMALEATWKYVFICSTGIALAYLGILFLGFIYGRGDAANLSFASFANIINNANPLYLKIAFLFVLIGFSTTVSYTHLTLPTKRIV